MPAFELTLSVVGIDHPNPDRSKSNRRFEIALCAPGDPVELRAEPKDPHDENAVAVFSERGIQLGYLRSERAALIARKLAAGEDAVAVFQGSGRWAAAIRARLGGGAPTLPAASAPEMAEDAFHADAEGSEWGA